MDINNNKENEERRLVSRTTKPGVAFGFRIELERRVNSGVKDMQAVRLGVYRLPTAGEYRPSL